MITNRYGISEDMAKAVTGGKGRRLKDPSRFSVTQLLMPTRMAALSELYEGDEDVADMVPAFIGTCVHYYLEKRVPGENEVRLEAKIGEDTVVGVIDSLRGSEIVDYKVRKASDSDFGDARRQIMCYAWLLRKARGDVATSGKIVAIRKDWSKMRDSAIPPIEEIRFRITPSDAAEAGRFIEGRIAVIKAARSKLPECSPEDRWNGGDSFAVCASGERKARRVFASEAEATAYAKPGMRVERRRGRDLRCEMYCPYARICRRFSAIAGKRS